MKNVRFTTYCPRHAHEKCACISQHTLTSHIGNYVKKILNKHKKNRKEKNKTRDGDPPPSTPQREAVEGGSTFAHPCD